MQALRREERGARRYYCEKGTRSMEGKTVIPEQRGAAACATLGPLPCFSVRERASVNERDRGGGRER